jgi:hypothetical protein
MHIQPHELFNLPDLKEVFNFSHQVDWQLEQLVIQFRTVSEETCNIELNELQTIYFHLVDLVEISELKSLQAVLQGQSLHDRLLAKVLQSSVICKHL